ncbi:MAG: nucleotidyltransferase family protein [Planctomycetaceae bacterium]
MGTDVHAPATFRDVTALILAGGLGTRLRRVVADRPKVLAPVQGRPFLANLLDQLADAGLRHAVLCTGFCAEQVRETFGPRWRSLELEYSHEAQPLGTGGALRQALELSRSTTVLALNGDSYCDAKLATFFAAHEAGPFSGSLLLTEVADASRYGRVEFTTDGRLVSFVEKQAAAGAGWINAGVYLFERALFAEVPPGIALSLERDLLPQWAARSLLGADPCGEAFLDIGTPESYGMTEKFFERQRVSK